MKTFTTYAEKKAKQFLNLLQGYTKGIRMTALLILLLMGVGNAWAANLYLLPNSNWTQANARFAAYFFGNGEKWVSMSETVTVNGTKYYKVAVPSGYPKVIFCRMNPSNSTNNWNNKWNQTGDLTIPTDGKNLFSIPSGAWDGSTTSWGNIELTITYKDQGNVNFSGTHGSGAPTKHKYDGGGTTLKSATKTGYTFAGWFTSSDCSGTAVTSLGATAYTADITLYAKWTPNTYTVSFDNNGGTGTMSSQSFTYDKAQNLTANTFNRTNYSFNGWNTKANGTGTNYTDKASVKNLTTTNNGTVTLYAQWKENTVKVTITTNGHGTTNPDKETNVGVISGCEIIATPDPGYRFVNWTTEDAGITIATPNSNKTTITATAAGTITANFELIPPTTVYLKPNSNWKSDNARFAAYVWTDGVGSEWIDMKDVGCSGDYYYCEVPAKYTKVIFGRMNPSTTANNFNDGVKWNQTGDQTIPTDNKVLFTITTWDSGSWGTYTAPSYNITLNPTVGGLIEVTPTGGSATTTNTSVTVNTKVKVTLLPNTGYATGTAKIKIGSNSEETLVDGQEYEICANTTITAEFIPTNPTPVYLKVAGHNWKNDNAWFAIYWWNSSGDGWRKMTAVDCNGDYYYGEVAAGAANFAFVRLIPEGHTDYNAGTNGDGMDWSNKWAQTVDLLLPSESSNLYTVGSKSGEKYIGSWSAYSAPTYDATINITGKGSIIVDGETYTGTSEGTTTLKINNIALNHTIEVGAITPAERWAYSDNATIKIGTNEQTALTESTTHTICGPTTINLTFDQTKCEVVFNLGIPKGVPIPNWTINNQYIDPGDTVVKPTVGEINGYLFGGWYTTGEYSDATLYNFGTPVTKDIKLHARWVRYEECIFFKNNLNWDKIYVYTFTGDVWSEKGVTPKNNRNNFGQMTRIGLSDVYYYILTDLNGFAHIAFSDYDMSNYNEFYEHNAIYRADRQDKMQLFIPQRDQVAKKTNKTSYFSSGLWMKYNSNESGYKWSSDRNGWSADINPFTAPVTGGYTFTVKVTLSGATLYKFKLNDINGHWYGRIGTMTQDDCTDWWFENKEWGANDDNGNAKIQPNVTGEYLFTLYLGDGKVMVSLEYPLSVGDYRLAYQDNTDDSFHPGHYIRKRSIEYKDTVSFFIHHNNQPQILLQHCTAIDPATGTATWETDNTYSVNVEATSVYNFVLQQTDSRAELLTDATHLYTGEFYIRTDAAEGGWDYFRQTANLMNFSTYASDHEHFTHYFCRWITANKNVKFTIGNDYSLCISDTLDGDDLIRKENVAEGSLPVDANVRFTWDNRNNTITRAYIAGSAWTRDRFLVLQGNDQLKDTLGNAFIEGELESDRDGLHANEVMFTDLGNWIYQTDVNVNAQTLIRLIATYNESVQYFKGSEAEPINLLSTTASKDYKVRLIYDFKTNHLVVAWLAGGNTVDGEDQELGADMMIIRHNQNGAEQLQFNPNSNTLSGVGTGYAVMTFDKYFLNNLNEEGNELPDKKSQYERAFYWVSFPFDVKLRDVFGFGEYGQHWIMEYYDGAARAANGYWIDSDTYWKYITNLDYTLKAGQGYVLCLNLNKMGTSSTVFTNTSEVSLYFPSASPLQTITGAVTTAIVPEHKCTIERDYRYIYDSNWNLIGVPGYKDIASVGVGGSAHEGLEDPNVTEDCINFYYRYIPATNKYEATNNPQTNNFQTMFAYMVQYAGTVEWSAPEFVKGIAARRTGDMPSEYTLRLELYQSDASADQTIIKLQEQDATADFDLNVDMTKIFNSGLNIYTLTGTQNIQVAGNALPMAKTTVPVGVRIATAGEYTFRMPDGTDGINVILVDNQTGAHTDMLYDEYTVTLDAGTFENRFHLIVDPDRAATSVENVGNEAQGDEVNGNDATGVKKYIIDGRLIIRTNGNTFDAQGHKL